MKRGVKCAVFLLALSALMPRLLLAEIEPAIAEALLRSANDLSEAVAKSSSFQLEATATITHSEDLLARIDASQRDALRLVKNNYSIAGKKGQISILLTPVDTKGTAASSERYLFNDESAIFEIHGSESSARIFPASQQKLYEICPFLTEFSFLRDGVDTHGLPSWLPDEVADFGKAMRNAIKDLKSVKALEGGAIQAEFERPWGKAQVTFKPKTVGSKILYPVHTVLLSKRGSKWREVEVLEFPKDASDFSLPTVLKYSTFSPEDAQGKSMHLATWVVEYRGLNLEAEVDESAVTFDPSRMNRILDTKTNVWLTVPK